MPAEGNGDLQALICVLVVRPRQCSTLSNRCFVADQLWFMTCIRQEEEEVKTVTDR